MMKEVSELERSMEAGMTKSKGFTLVEMMVSFAVFAIVAMAAYSFFHVHSKQGAGSAKRKIALESVAVAAMNMKRDIIQAGLGLSMEPALALFVTNGSGTNPDTLYISWADYLDIDLDSSKTNSFFDDPSTIVAGQGKAWFNLVTTDTLTVPNVRYSTARRDADSVIMLQGIAGSGGSTKVPVGPPYPTVVQSTSNININKNTADLNLKMNAAFSGKAVPAISYRLLFGTNPDGSTRTTTDTRQPQNNWGTLVRNGRSIAGAGDVVDASDTSRSADESQRSFIKITDLQVDCQFSDDTWVPATGSPNTFGTGSYTSANLRLVQVTLRFIIKDEGGGYLTPDKIPGTGYRIIGDYTPGPWTIGGTYTFRVSPRNVVLSSYLHSAK